MLAENVVFAKKNLNVNFKEFFVWANCRLVLLQLEKKSYRHVKYCSFCDDGKICDNNFDNKNSFETTSFHQIKKDLAVFRNFIGRLPLNFGAQANVYTGV